MLDFDAPTGGYLLQAAFATGRAAGAGAARFLGLRAIDAPSVVPSQTGLAPRHAPNGREPVESNKYSV
jgi:hypothetical protein